MSETGISAGVERRLALFLASVCEMSWTGDVDAADVQEEAERLGLITKEPFDPATHHDPSGVAEAGDTFYVIASDVRGVIDGTLPPSAVRTEGK